MQDIHTHLYWESYNIDRDEVIARAREAGVQQMLVVGTTLEESERAVALANQEEGLFAAVGIHPNQVRDSDIHTLHEEWFTELKQLAEHPKVVAIGECGLDYSASHGTITEEEKVRQAEVFLQHISLAVELKLPLIVHCRPTNAGTQDAYEALYRLIKDNASNIEAVILHCYMGDTEITRKFLSISNIYFSFTGNITYPVKKGLMGTKDDITETVKCVPLNQLFLETDCPFLAPQDMRGKRNEPAYMRLIRAQASKLLGVDEEELDTQLNENFQAVFRRG